MSNLITFKLGVDTTKVHPHLWFHLGIVAEAHASWTNKKLVVTSARRPCVGNWLTTTGNNETPKSWHHVPLNWYVRAVDIRTWYLDEDCSEGNEGRIAFGVHLQGLVGDELGVVVEPDWLSAAQIKDRGGIDKITPHIHLQSKATHLLHRLLTD